MSQPNPNNPTPDDLLADFTDRVLDGKTSVPASPADAELRGLEEAVLRLKQTLPQRAPDEKTFRRLQTDFRVRVRKADSPTLPVRPFWRPRQRLVLTFAAVALAVLLIAFPFLAPLSGSVEGTAGLQPQDVILLAGALCMIVLLIWVGRRK